MAMQMLMIIAESEHREKIESALSDHHVLGYTEIPTVYGTGRTGPRLGSRAFPETSSIIFTVVEAERIPELRAALEKSCQCSETTRMIVWKVDQML